jgi:hypothetical protein
LLALNTEYGNLPFSLFKNAALMGFSLINKRTLSMLYIYSIEVNPISICSGDSSGFLKVFFSNYFIFLLINFVYDF